MPHRIDQAGMGGQLDRSANVSRRVAMVLLGLFFVAVVAALAVTLSSGSARIGLLAASAVTPIVIVTLIILYFESQRRPWSFVGAAALGALGITLRLLVNTQPNLEVGGGLPLWVTATYVALGTLVIAASLWALLAQRRANRTSSSRPPPFQ
jgi:ABC-type cobalamin transport system permease subunit